ncbi:MAG: Ig-like domain-containing protein, partial [Butyricicoccus sp.]|nr:Ig-like domain-containing protein [Butyricicoccus sp.]
GNTFEGYTLCLDADIDLAGHLWQPIGGWNGSAEDTTKYFAGTFDGQGHDIVNMTISRPDYDYNGLFGGIKGATVKNLELQDCTVEGASSTAILAGTASSQNTIINCGVSGAVKGSGLCDTPYVGSVQLYNCYVRASFSGMGSMDYALGTSGTYTNCWYDADLWTNKAAGSNAETVDCYGITAESLEETDYTTLLNDYLLEDKLEWIEGEDGYPTFGTKFDPAWKNHTIKVEPEGGIYYIGTAGELAYIAELVNSGNRLTDCTVKLMDDIDLTGKYWTPIGWDYDNPFEGEFDGNHKTITGMTIAEQPMYEKIGLIGHMRFMGDPADAGIHDVTLEEPVIHGTFANSAGIGGLVGSYIYGGIENCHVIDCDFSVSLDIGGLVGEFAYSTIADCSVSGKIQSENFNAGGIAYEMTEGQGSEQIKSCSFSGEITAGGAAGGIVCPDRGMALIVEECFAEGTVQATGNAGGIMSASGEYWRNTQIRNCYSSCAVTSQSGLAGGVAAVEASRYRGTLSIQNSYAFGDVSGSTGAGAIFGGTYDANTITIENCYWYDGVKLTQLGMEVPSVGMAGTTDLTRSLTLDQMKRQSSFAGFDFDTVWAIDAGKNGGFPYLKWQTAVPEVVEPTAVSLNTASLSMDEGSTRWLAVSFEPANASGTITWTSADEDIARVTEGGQVIAVSAGETVITATCGRLTASCAVTVSERPEDSYVLGELELLSASEQPLDAIPRDSFWVNVSVTKQEESDDAVVVLATYGSDGKFLNLYAMKTNAAVGTEQVFSVLLDNRAGKIAEIRAFVWSSLASPVPLAAAVGV